LKGIYVNVPDAADRIAAFDHLLGIESCIAVERRAGLGDIVISYRSSDWPHGPVFSDPSNNLFAAVSGWLSFRGRLGDLRGLALALFDAKTDAQRSAVLTGIDGGSFVLLTGDPSGYRIITDPFGLHPHYVCGPSATPRIAPAPSFLKSPPTNESASVPILKAMNHAVGNHTGYAGIERIPPGAIITGSECYYYFDYTPAGFDPGELIQELRFASELFAERKRLLPLSGGLDSRLLLATGSFDLGYTFGPSAHGDRPIARQFRQYFTDGYDEFSLLDLEYPATLKKAAAIMFDGLCPHPFSEILAVFRRLSRRWGADLVLFDGYLGDVLTRWSWLNMATRRDQLLRPFPAIRLRGASAGTILRQRYGTVTDNAYEIIADAYANIPVGQNLDPLRRLIIFEILFGRGARYIVNGNSIMGGQFFTSVQPFFFPKVFRRLFAIDPRNGVGLNALHQLWKTLPLSMRRPRTSDGHVLAYPPVVNRLFTLQHAVLKKLLPGRFQDYGDELPHIPWKTAQ
jgi:hypothetical protein